MVERIIKKCAEIELRRRAERILQAHAKKPKGKN